MASHTQLLQAGVDADQFFVGPAVILAQLVANYSTSGEAAAAFPEGLEDVIDITTAVAMTANGWFYLGYTENLGLGRNRATVQLDADQEARIKTVHDAWENTITFTALETTTTRLGEWWQAHSGYPETATGAVPSQTMDRFGNPATINYQRVAVLFMDDTGVLWGWVYRKCNIRPTGGPTFTRTGRVEWPLEITCHPDTRVSDVDDRVLRLYKTDATIDT